MEFPLRVRVVAPVQINKSRSHLRTWRKETRVQTKREAHPATRGATGRVHAPRGREQPLSGGSDQGTEGVTLTLVGHRDHPFLQRSPEKPVGQANVTTFPAVRKTAAGLEPLEYLKKGKLEDAIRRVLGVTWWLESSSNGTEWRIPELWVGGRGKANSLTGVLAPSCVGPVALCLPGGKHCLEQAAKRVTHPCEPGSVARPRHSGTRNSAKRTYWPTDGLGGWHTSRNGGRSGQLAGHPRHGVRAGYRGLLCAPRTFLSR